MSTIRFFDGGRDKGFDKKSVAAQIMRIEFEKKGKLSSAERFKLIMKRKMDEQKKALGIENIKPVSQRAEQALKQVAARKAAKEAKKLRQQVIVTPRHLVNGRITDKGKVFDIAGNMVAEINRKNGKIATMNGWQIGKYKPNKRTEYAIQDAIYKYSPYYINLQKMQALQNAGIDPLTGRPVNEVINVYVPDNTTQVSASNALYGASAEGPGKAIVGTAWGARSDNVWGTFGENAHGTFGDNVWGRVSTDIWGGVGAPSGFGKSVQMWGTGNGKNYLKKLTNYVAGLFGRKNKKTVDAFKAHRRSRSGGTPPTPAPRARR